ncbi:MAG: ABC transporter permease [Pontiellaceae bacterium]|nr:ABC transporter permease [Pontiellaceae bacterium]
MIRLLLSSLRHYWRIHLGVLLATALASAVLTGSLLVGDSVDGTLRCFALQRLGGIHYAMQVPHRTFSDSLGERISPKATTLLQLRGMALADKGQINQVQVYGCKSAFWNFAGLALDLEAGEIAINQKLADALRAGIGDEVSLRIENPGLLPLDAPLSAQDAERSVRGRFTVKRILGDDELGRFGLSPSQAAPFNAFVNLEWLQERTDRVGLGNLLVAGADDPWTDFAKAWTPEDFGFRFVQDGATTQLETDGIYLDPEAERAALSIPGAAGTLTYLVNSLSKGESSTPYSFVLAMDREGLGDDEIVINRWLADELEASVGDTIRMRYYELLPSGQFEERERAFRVRGILEMQDLEQERSLAPPFPGLTDVDRCADWDVGIPMDETALEDEANEAYWNAYRQTPKAIVSLAAGQSMWSNRFGSLTSVRWTNGEEVEAAFRAAYRPEAAGYQFQPVREQALEAVQQAMDFGELFLGMSFFLILSALLLTALVFVFGVQRRAEEMGILLAVGWRRQTIRSLQIAEGGIVALAGSIGGAWLGVGYTKLLIHGLAHGWGGAVANTSIHYFAQPPTVFIGAVSAFICALLAMAITAWRQTRHPVRELLQADFAEEFNPSMQAPERRKIRMTVLVSGLLFLVALLLVAYSLIAEGRNLTMWFFGAGALLLAAGIGSCSIPLRRFSREDARWSIAMLARRNAGRRRGRSLSVIGLVAAGCFLVFAVSSMQEDVAAHADQPWSGTGGFPWFGESTLAIKDGLDGINLRVRDGDDASCLNLNRARSPRLLGVDPAVMSARKAFMDGDNIWKRLDLDLPDGMVPGLVGDSDTAMWGLEATTGVEKGDVIEYIDDHGKPFKVKLVGTLPMRLSVFQGTVLIAEHDFVERYSSESGYRMFLLDERPDTTRYERLGLDVVSSVDRLREFYAVESTYLGMFLVLGALGLAVGSLGLGVVVMRNVQDRRAELALLMAVGYRVPKLRNLLWIEHGTLLAAGLGIGGIAAVIAMVPALFLTHADISPSLMLRMLLLVVACAVACMGIAIRIALRINPLSGLRNE